MSIEAVGAIEPPNPTAGPVVPEAITEPIAKASRQAYEHFAGKFEWYREQWEDVVHEAKTVRARKYSLEGVSVADVLSGLGGAKVASSLPGRAAAHQGAQEAGSACRTDRARLGGVTGNQPGRGESSDGQRADSVRCAEIPVARCAAEGRGGGSTSGRGGRP